MALLFALVSNLSAQQAQADSVKTPDGIYGKKAGWN